MSKEYWDKRLTSRDVQRVFGSMLLGFSGVILAGMAYGTVHELDKPAAQSEQTPQDSMQAEGTHDSAFTASGLASATMIAATGSFLLYRTRQAKTVALPRDAESLPLDQSERINKLIQSLDYPTPEHIVDLYPPEDKR